MKKELGCDVLCTSSNSTQECIHYVPHTCTSKIKKKTFKKIYKYFKYSDYKCIVIFFNIEKAYYSTITKKIHPETSNHLRVWV